MKKSLRGDAADVDADVASSIVTCALSIDA
jgi:hypothetical protein